MKTVTTTQMRELDRRMIEELHVPGEVLMERAGEGVARHVRALAQESGRGACLITLVAGKGNNGGDALVAARLLAAWGFPVRVWLAARLGDLAGDALRNARRLVDAGHAIEERSAEAAWDAGAHELIEGIVVDGVFGTGFGGPARGVGAAAIRCVNRMSARSPVVAIDVPSGLDADTGRAEGDVVKADVTVTLAFPKAGLLVPQAVDCVGSLSVVDIGIPAHLTAEWAPDVALITAEDLRPLFARRHRASHKGSYGHALIIGGSAGYSGAVSMAAAAAVRSGVGLVSVLVPQRLAQAVAAVVPEAMVHPGEETPSGELAPDALSRLKRGLSDFDAVLMGPGMTAEPSTRLILDKALASGCGCLVLDADALSVIAGQMDLTRRCTVPLALTPHPGEMARMMRTTAEEIQSDRFGFTRRAAELTRGVVVLKGAGTVVGEREGPLRVNLTGNPGMARGGSGDVLAGLLCGLAAQGIYLGAAAAAAVYLHGRAGDLAARHGTQAGMAAMDIVRCLPEAFRDVTFR
jgi:hydroxyethylthiazole kinase-like uncharacterized protein yjeF